MFGAVALVYTDRHLKPVLNGPFLSISPIYLFIYLCGYISTTYVTCYLGEVPHSFSSPTFGMIFMSCSCCLFSFS